MRRAIRLLVMSLGLVVLSAAGLEKAAAQVTVGSITTTEGDISVRLMGFGLVVGLDGTGDRNISGYGTSGTSARAVANLLQRFGMPVDDSHMRVRNVAAVIVQASVNPYLRAGQRFDLHVSSLHDATSLAGGELIVMPLLTDPNDTLMLATGSGPLLVRQDPAGRILRRGGTSGRVPGGGLVEVDLPRPQVSGTPTLSLNSPDVTMATRVAAVINGAFGDGTATVVDPGSVQLNPPTEAADNLIEFLAGVDTLSVATYSTPKVIIGQDGSVATVGNIMLGQATTVSHNGITLTIGGTESAPSEGILRLPIGAPVQDIAAGLHAAGATPHEVATLFEMLKKAGVIAADIELQ